MYKFNGKELQPGTGWLDYRARMMAPQFSEGWCRIH
jgi:hypothetical protein